MDNNDTSGKALINFWVWAANKGEMNANTASAMKAACLRVLQIESNWESIDIRILNIDDFSRRFQNKCGQDFTTSSLSDYLYRFRKGIGLFLNWIQNPSSWNPPQKKGGSRKEKTSKGPATEFDNKEDIQPLNIEKPIEHLSFPLPSPSRSPLVEYPFPIREGQLVYFKLPADLTSAEVRRMTAHLTTLAIDAHQIGN